MGIIEALILALHLICVGVASAGPGVCAWLEWREGRGSTVAGDAGRWLLGVSLWALLAGALLGLLLGFSRWSDGYYNVFLKQLGGKLHVGGMELLFSVALMLAHFFWWRAKPTATWQRAARVLLAVLASTNLLYHFPLLFFVAGDLLHNSADRVERLTHAEFRGLMLRSATLARSLHFVLAAVVATGGALLYYAWRRAGAAAGPNDSKQNAAGPNSAGPNADEVARRSWLPVSNWGGKLALFASVPQIPVGVWLLTQLPPAAQGKYLGNDVIASGLMLVGVLLALWLMHCLAATAFGKSNRRALARALIVLGAVMVVMTLMAEHVKA